MNPEASTLPRVGMLATVRNRRGVISNIKAWSDAKTSEQLHLVTVEFSDADGEPEETLLWERERVAWWSATLPAGTVPVNRDGEVERFACWSHARVQAELAAGAFTPEAALVLAAYYGW